MAAARATCDGKPGVACILGTGSNSCIYDGKNITIGNIELRINNIEEYIVGILPSLSKSKYDINTLLELVIV